MIRLFILTAALSLLAAPQGGAASAPGEISGELSGNPRYFRDAIVYIERVPGTHSAPAKPVQLDQKNHKFVPATLPIVQGSTVRFLNNDHEAHNVFSPDNEKYDLGNWTGGEHRDYTFGELGVYTQLCKLHPSMIGYVVVLQNPFFAPVTIDGSFTIRNVPPGKYTIRAWQARGEGTADVTVTANETTETAIQISRRVR